MPDWAATIVIVTVIGMLSLGLGTLIAWTESPPRRSASRARPKRRGSFWHAWSDSPHRPRR